MAAPFSPRFLPLTRERWADLETLFGSNGAYGGCWCMWWRLTRRELEAAKGEGNRKAFRNLVEGGHVPGILAYLDDRPVGWCAVDRRENLASLERSPVLKRVDNQPVWSITCLFIDRRHRRRGLALALVRAATEYVRRQGGRIVEAYPTVPKKSELPPVSSYMGTPSLFARAGFVEAARPSAARMVMRLALPP